jgi:hypothetical protein
MKRLLSEQQVKLSSCNDQRNVRVSLTFVNPRGTNVWFRCDFAGWTRPGQGPGVRPVEKLARHWAMGEMRYAAVVGLASAGWLKPTRNRDSRPR